VKKVQEKNSMGEVVFQKAKKGFLRDYVIHILLVTFASLIPTNFYFCANPTKSSLL
jgi:hypothetical protein